MKLYTNYGQMKSYYQNNGGGIIRFSINKSTTIAEILSDNDIAKIKLEDDGSPYGGVAYEGETLKNFMMECHISPNDTFLSLQRRLRECGIEPLKLFKEI